MAQAGDTSNTFKDSSTPAYWEGKVRGWYAYADDVLRDYAKYSKWYAGDMSDIANQIRRQTRSRSHVLTNLLNLVVRTSRADLFFRCPRFFVKETQAFGPSVFTPELAKLETTLLNKTAEDVNLYREGQRVIDDMLLGPFGVFKIGYSGEVAIDDDWVDTQREQAHTEDILLIQQGKKPKVTADDYHRGHLDTHQATLAAIERGDITTTTRLKNYLIKHIAFHQDALEQYGDLPSEIIKNESVFVRRRSPLRVFFDPWAESPDERTWVGEALIRRKEDVENDPRYDAEARMQLQSVTIQEANTKMMNFSEVNMRYEMLRSGYDQEEHVIIYEIVDLRNRKVITYTNGCNKPLRYVDYKLWDILPSGPYISSSFNYDPITDLGICPPSAYESHQVTASILETVATIAARRSVPQMVAVGDFFDPADLEKIRSGIPAGLHILKNLRQGMKIEDILQQLPETKISDQTFRMIARHQSMIEQLSGRGSARVGGGDSSRTATASQIVNDSVNNLSDEMGSTIDNLMSEVGKKLLRLMRRFYSPVKIAELLGEEMLDYWPEEWAERDILNDRGVIVIPGSSTRKNDAVEKKLLMELYSVLASDPILSQDVAPRIEILKRVLEANGIYDIDLEMTQKRMQMQQEQQQADEQAQQQGQGGQGGPGNAPGAPGGAAGSDPRGRVLRRATAPSEGTRAAVGQGASNPGGGRVPTGASVGDKPRLMR